MGLGSGATASLACARRTRRPRPPEWRSVAWPKRHLVLWVGSWRARGYRSRMASMGRILTNDFSWSKSRDDKFQQCLRAYYLHYYKSWGGWDEEAPAEARGLYLLKKLSNRFSWAGAVGHEAICHVLIGIRFGRNIE